MNVQLASADSLLTKGRDEPTSLGDDFVSEMWGLGKSLVLRLAGVLGTGASQLRRELGEHLLGYHHHLQMKH